MDYSNIFKILSDDTRLNIIVELSKESHCVCELQNILHLDQPKISKHLKKIRDAGLVSISKKETFIYYSLVDNDLIKLVVQFIKSSKDY